MISRSTNVRAALRSRQRGFLLNPARFGAGAPTDPNFANVTLLMHGEGADGSTTFSDNSPSPKTVTGVGTAQIDTAQFKFGAASILFDGSGYLTSATNAGFRFDTNDLTVEAFVRFGAGGLNPIFGTYDDTDGGFLVAWNGTALLSYADGISVTRTWAPSLGVWYHVAVCRASGVTRMFVDGTLLGTSFADSRQWTPANPVALSIGRITSGGSDLIATQHLDEIRFTKGVARYTADFTPPSAPFPNS